MNAKLTTHAYHSLMVGILLGLAGPACCDDTLTGSTVLDGGVVGDGAGPQLDAPGYTDNYQVTANYTITLTSGGLIDPSSTVTFTGIGSKKKGSLTQTTNPIPITSVTINPTTKKLISFTFYGSDWYTGRGSNAVDGTSILGTITVDPNGKKNGTGWIYAAYVTKDGKTTSNYSFSTDTHIPPGNQKSQPATSRIPANKSIDYDATTGILSISDDTIIGTANPSDPILGAAVTYPEFQFEGFTSDGSMAIFWPTSATPYTVTGSGVYQQSAIPFLYYDTETAMFYATLDNTTLAGMSPDSLFFDAGLADSSSPFLQSLDSILDPASPGYDPNAYLYLDLNPDTNFAALTNNFTTSGDTGAYDVEVAADPAPEPPTLILFGFALCVPIVLRALFKFKAGSGRAKEA